MQIFGTLSISLGGPDILYLSRFSFSRIGNALVLPSWSFLRIFLLSFVSLLVKLPLSPLSCCDLAALVIGFLGLFFLLWLFPTFVFCAFLLLWFIDYDSRRNRKLSLAALLCTLTVVFFSDDVFLFGVFFACLSRGLFVCALLIAVILVMIVLRCVSFPPASFWRL